jgi:hypothetical protein
LSTPNARIRAKQLVTLCFCCQGWWFAFILEGLHRDPIEQTRISKPLAGEHWWHHPDAPHVLKPGSPSSTYPYPVELDLPPWIEERDIDLIDLRNWLLGFGAASASTALRPCGMSTARSSRVRWRCTRPPEAPRSSVERAGSALLAGGLLDGLELLGLLLQLTGEGI